MVIISVQALEDLVLSCKIWNIICLKGWECWKPLWFVTKMVIFATMMTNVYLHVRDDLLVRTTMEFWIDFMEPIML